MNINEAVIAGIRIPCDHKFEILDIYRHERKYNKRTSQKPITGLMQLITGSAGTVTVKRWLATCPHCGKLWFATSSKKDLICLVKKINIKPREIQECEAIQFKEKSSK